MDARFAYSTTNLVSQSLQLVELYAELGIPKTKFVLKIPTTFNGIQACEILEKEHDISCNMTVLFCLTQAVASAEAGASYVSPYLNLLNREDTNTKEGLQNVKEIRKYYDQNKIKTKILGASFRTPEQVQQRSSFTTAITVSPIMLEELNVNNPIVISTENDSQLKAVGPYLGNESLYQWNMTMNERSSIGLLEGLRFFCSFQYKIG